MNSLFLNIRTYRNKALSLALLLSIVVELFVPFYSAEASTTASTPEVITFTNVGNASWTVPEDVTSIKVKVWGAGGAGGSGEKINESNRSGLGGGAGGYVEKTLSVTPGDSYSITVGAGGQGIMSYIDGRVGNPGTDSRFEGSGVTLVAAGGRGGASYTGEANPIEPIGTGGSASGGDVNETGGNGGSYTEVDDNPYATSGGSAYNGGNGGSRGRCGRDGACPGSEIGSLLAQDGGFPGGGGGGSDVAEGGYGAHGLVTIEIPVPTVINEPPIGYLDTVSCTALQGWAYDPSSPSTVVGIHFYTEDALGNLVFIGDTAANVARADVNQNAGISGDHAFNFPLPTSLKNGLIHKIYAYALDSTDANLNTLLSNSPMSVGGCTNSSTGGNTGGTTQTPPVINSFTVNSTVSPVTVAQGTSISWSGSATKSTADILRYRAYVVGSQGGAWTAATNGASVSFSEAAISTATNPQSFYSGVGGYTLRFEVEDVNGLVSRQDRTITLTASGNTTGGTGTSGVNQPPIGYLDTVSCTALQGWAYDPSSPSTVVGIHFYTEDALGNLVFIGDTAANVARADVNQNAGISGDHAFNFPLPTSLKNGLIHKIYAYALDSTDANLNTLLSNSPMSVGGCTNSSTGGNTGGNTGNAGNITANITSNVGVCSVAGTPMVFTVVVSGSGVTSVVLEKDTNNDGVWGVATSWTTAGSHTYTSNEAANYTGTYKLRLLVNGSVVASREVNVQANCGGNSTGNNNGSGNNGGNQITASITTTAPGCVPVGTNIPFMINVSGSGVTSVVLEKDTNNDGVFGPAASWSSGGNQSFASSESAAYTGVYSLRLIVNGTIYDTRTVTVAASCTSTNFTVTPLTGLTTTEAGGQAVFTVVLNAAPLSNVTLPINSSNHNEGTTTPITFLTFTPANWNVSQAVTITGRDDSAVDGNVNYSVIVGPSVSSDMNANGMAAQSVFVTNNDNEAPTTSGGSSTGGSSSGGRGGGGGGRSNLRCTGFGCPTTSATTTTSTSSNNLGDIVILLDQPPTYTAPAVTGPELVCPSVNFITTFLKVGVDNNPNEVRKLQYFLNTYEGANLVIDGIFDTNTENAVKALQSKYTNEILSPWGVSTPTGIVYITTTNHINKVYCNDNPGYTGNESISDIIDNTVLYPEVDNSAEFEGEIGMATSTDDGSNSNLAGVGSISSRIWDGLKDIPLYLILILALMFTGAGIILSNVLKKDIPAHAVYVSLIKGSAVLAIGSVLNVLNIVSYILNPEWFMERSGFTLGWLLALNAINLGLIIAICLAVLISLYGRLARVRS